MAGGMARRHAGGRVVGDWWRRYERASHSALAEWCFVFFYRCQGQAPKQNQVIIKPSGKEGDPCIGIEEMGLTGVLETVEKQGNEKAQTGATGVGFVFVFLSSSLCFVLGHSQGAFHFLGQGSIERDWFCLTNGWIRAL